MAPVSAAWPRLRRLALTALLPLAVACSESEEDCPRYAHTGLEARAPFDARAAVRRVDCGFQSGVQNLTAGPDGAVWLRRTEFIDLGDDTFFNAPVKRLSHLGPGGEWRWELALPDYVEDIVAHPSGELTVLGWEKQADATKLQVLRLDAKGQELFRRVLSNDTPVAERLNFDAFPDGGLVRVEEPREGRRFVTLAAAAHGEDAYVFVSADGLRVMRLDPQLNVRWSRAVSPSVALRDFNREQMQAAGAPLVGWGLAVEASGRVQVAQSFLDVHRRAYVETLGRTPEGPPGRSILVSRFEPTGDFIAARTFPTEHADEVTGLAVRGESFAVGARNLTPLEREDKRTDTDLYFASGGWDLPADALNVSTLTLDDDDSPAAFIPCGAASYCFVGHTGYLDLNTGRTLQNGKGFVLALNEQGQQQSLLLLEGERDTEVVQAVPGPEGSVLFTFSTNQPVNIARVANRLKNNETWLGRVGVP